MNNKQRILDKIINAYLYVVNYVKIHQVITNLQKNIQLANSDLDTVKFDLSEKQNQLEDANRNYGEAYKKSTFHKELGFDEAKEQFIDQKKYHYFKKPKYNEAYLSKKAYIFALLLLWGVMSGILSGIVDPQDHWDYNSNMYFIANLLIAVGGLFLAFVVARLIKKAFYRLLLHKYHKKINAQNAQIMQLAKDNYEDRCKSNKEIFDKKQDKYGMYLEKNPFEIDDLKDQINKLKKIIQNYQGELTKAEKISDEILFDPNTMVEVPQERQLIPGYYAKLYEVIKTGQETTIGKAIEKVEDRWEDDERNIKLRKTIYASEKDLQQTINKGFDTLDRTILEAAQRIDSNVSILRNNINATNKELTKVNNSIENQTNTLGSMISDEMLSQYANTTTIDNKLDKSNKKLADIQGAVNNVNNKINH